MNQQLAFDIDSLIDEAVRDALPAWDGAPLHYHEDYYSPEELASAFERWVLENGHHGSIPRSQMWHQMFYDRDSDLAVGEHELTLFHADRPSGHGVQAICRSCAWHSIHENHNLAVEAWHDHALPGWRTLPVVPQRLTQRRQTNTGVQKLHDWVADHYPAEWQQPGFPIITERQGSGTRHVPGRSPWGGFDLSDSCR